MALGIGVFHAGVLQKGVMYKVMLTGEDGQQLERRDPYARQTDYETAWCIVDDARGMPRSDWQPLPFDEYLIYEVRCCHLSGWRHLWSHQSRDVA